MSRLRWWLDNGPGSAEAGLLRDVAPRSAESLSAAAYAEQQWERRGRRRVISVVVRATIFLALFIGLTRGIYLALRDPHVDEAVADCRARLQHARTGDDSLRVVAFAGERTARGCLAELRARLR